MEQPEYKHDYFPFSEGGPVHGVLTRIHVYESRKKLVLLFWTITWLPLLILSIYEGTLTSGDFPFLTDAATHARLLIALPMMLLIAGGIDYRIIEVKKYFAGTLMSGESQQREFDRILVSSRKLAESRIAEAAILLLIITVTVGYGNGSLIAGVPDGGSWTHVSIGGQNMLTKAGTWLQRFSIPVYQFLLLRWFWRHVVWSIMLFRLSRTDMNLQATHPDKAGGLAVLMHAQKFFCTFFVAANVGISGQLCVKLLSAPDAFLSIRNDVFGYIGIFLVLIFLPMVFFSPKLLTVKENGLLHLSRTGARMSRMFEKEWVANLKMDEADPDTVIDPSTMQDYDTVFESLKEMRIVPFTVKDVMFVAILLFIPFLPILFIHFSVKELLGRLLGLLL